MKKTEKGCFVVPRDEQRLAGADAGRPSRPGTVPYIASWSGERLQSRPLVIEDDRYGIAYFDEVPHDRDSRGVLWQRAAFSSGKGRALFGKVHPARQRRAMRKLLCQICAGPADRTEQGVLWLLKNDCHDWPNWPENMGATHPPICLPCAKKSTHLCPHLRGRHITVRVKSPEVAGVYGALYRPGFPFPRAMEDATVEYGDARIQWVVATQLVMALHDCTVVDLEAELAASGVGGE